ncbi:hypothetical protein AABM38_20880 [Heyndrickxia sp. MSNUG]|uniref:hypothetical protein n=1 Tax=Heyndrickxia sp. MSNUG TaxID=3136677 RepID=UPI003C2CCC0D
MEERIESFMNEIQKKNHIMLLVTNLDLCLSIEAEKQTYYLSFKKKKVEFSKERAFPAAQYAKLSGREDLLIHLLDGHIKLREGISIGYFNLVCPFRTLLVLESIFYLARPMTLKVFI